MTSRYCSLSQRRRWALADSISGPDTVSYTHLWCDMRVILAKSAGFCYGVERAVKLAEQTARDKGGCVMLGSICLLYTSRCV